MGYALTWCAVREEGAETFLQRLGLTATGATEGGPASLITAAHLDTGWQVLWYNKTACPFLRPRDLEHLSNNLDIVVCRIEEHVMASSAEMWSGGIRRWWLSHEGESGPRGLATDGELPQNFISIREELEKQQRADGGDQADVDSIFEIPLRVAQSVTGFQHDDDRHHVIGPWAVLSRSRHRSLLDRLSLAVFSLASNAGRSRVPRHARQSQGSGIGFQRAPRRRLARRTSRTLGTRRRARAPKKCHCFARARRPQAHALGPRLAAGCRPA